MNYKIRDYFNKNKILIIFLHNVVLSDMIYKINRIFSQFPSWKTRTQFFPNRVLD